MRSLNVVSVPVAIVEVSALTITIEITLKQGLPVLTFT